MGILVRRRRSIVGIRRLTEIETAHSPLLNRASLGPSVGSKSTWTKILVNLDKYICQFGNIYLSIWTNIFVNLDKYICQFGQIYMGKIEKASFSEPWVKVNFNDLSMKCYCWLHVSSQHQSVTRVTLDHYHSMVFINIFININAIKSWWFWWIWKELKVFIYLYFFVFVYLYICALVAIIVIFVSGAPAVGGPEELSDNSNLWDAGRRASSWTSHPSTPPSTPPWTPPYPCLISSEIGKPGFLIIWSPHCQRIRHSDSPPKDVWTTKNLKHPNVIGTAQWIEGKPWMLRG